MKNKSDIKRNRGFREYLYLFLIGRRDAFVTFVTPRSAFLPPTCQSVNILQMTQMMMKDSFLPLPPNVHELQEAATLKMNRQMARPKPRRVRDANALKPKEKRKEEPKTLKLRTMERAMK